jgi:small-conductance mechanosensitive channel
MDIRLLESLIIIPSFFAIQFFTVLFLKKIQKKYNYSSFRVRPILKIFNLFSFATFIVILIAIWGIEQAKLLTFITSFLTVVGIALVAQWSILSNIASALIIFISHPVKLGESITIMDKEFQINGQVIDIGLFFITIKNDENEKILLPNNVLLQKATKISV